MQDKYPLLLKPVLKDYIWGGERLIKEFGFDATTPTVAEGWMLSSHKDGTNVVANGKYQGKMFDEVLESWGYNQKFPILIKFIDAKDRLSVQVHPDNEYALKNEGEYGKTEMWYVVDCEADAKLAYGFNCDIDSDEFRNRIEANTLTEVINFVPVKKGDVFFITAGTLHAIGSGILIAEIQQNSNSTYRVSDYGRLGKDGKPRELHIDKAVDVTITKKPTLPYGDIGETEQTDCATKRVLAECEYFKAEKYNLCGEKEIYCENNFVSLLILSGKAEILFDNGNISVKKGDSVFVPSGCKCKISGNVEFIYTLG